MAKKGSSAWIMGGIIGFILYFVVSFISFSYSSWHCNNGFLTVNDANPVFCNVMDILLYGSSSDKKGNESSTLFIFLLYIFLGVFIGWAIGEAKKLYKNKK